MNHIKLTMASHLAAEKINQRISIGSELLDREVLPDLPDLPVEDGFQEFLDAVAVWHQYNIEMLRRMFLAEDYALEYKNIGTGYSRSEKWFDKVLAEEKSHLRRRLAGLQSILARLDLFEVAEQVVRETKQRELEIEDLELAYKENIARIERVRTDTRVVVLTALSVEYQAVRSLLEEVDETTHPESGTVYEVGRLLWAEPPIRVAVAEIGAHNHRAGVEAERAISYFRPEVILFVGVAGGVKDVKLGDVVAATKVYAYDSGKALEDRTAPRPEVMKSSYKLEQRARAEARKGRWQGYLGDGSSAGPAHVSAAPEVPRVYVGPIAAGGQVISSAKSTIAKYLREFYGDTLAVEMEGAGFLHAAEVHANVEALVVRGISDLLDGKEEADRNGSQERAARHAAAFAFAVVRYRLQIEGEPLTPSVPPAALSAKEAYLEQLRRAGSAFRPEQCQPQIHSHGTYLSLAWSPDGQYLAAAYSHTNSDGVELWEANTWRRRHWLAEQKTQTVRALAFRPDGLMLASGSDDQIIRLWDPSTGQLMRSLHEHRDGIYGLCFWPTREVMISASSDKTLRVWGLESGQQLGVLMGHRLKVSGIAISADGAYMASCSNGSVDGFDTGEVLLWTHNENAFVSFPLFDSRCSGINWNAIAFNSMPKSPWWPEPRCSTMLAAAGSNGCVYVWDLATRQLSHVLGGGHNRAVTALSFDRHPDTLASVSRDNTVLVWDIKTGQVPSTLGRHEQQSAGIMAVAFSPDGKRVASAGFDHTIRVWDVATRSCRAVLAHAGSGWVAYVPQRGRYKWGGEIAGEFRLTLDGHDFVPDELAAVCPALRVPDEAVLST